MAKQTINIGTSANDGTGDPLRSAMDKANDNFTELYNGAGGVADGAITTAKLAADAVDGTKIADDSINSEHYVDGSIDTVHFSATTEIALVTNQNSGNLKLWSGSQAQYDALTPDSDTIYFIV